MQKTRSLFVAAIFGDIFLLSVLVSLYIFSPTYFMSIVGKAPLPAIILTIAILWVESSFLVTLPISPSIKIDFGFIIFATLLISAGIYLTFHFILGFPVNVVRTLLATLIAVIGIHTSDIGYQKFKG